MDRREGYKKLISERKWPLIRVEGKTAIKSWKHVGFREYDQIGFNRCHNAAIITGTISGLIVLDVDDPDKIKLLVWLALDFLYPYGDNEAMTYEIKTTKQYDKWLAGIKDRQMRNRILVRIDNMTIGSFGDHKTINANLFELRMFFGPGFRIYYTIQGREIIYSLPEATNRHRKKISRKQKSSLNNWRIKP